MKFDNEQYRLTEAGKLGKIALIVGVVGAILTGIGAAADTTQFFHSYLAAFAFWTAISLGGLFFTLVHHLVDATWSVVLRRIGECVMGNLPWMFLFLIPILLLVDKYEWAPIADEAHGKPAAHASAHAEGIVHGGHDDHREDHGAQDHDDHGDHATHDDSHSDHHDEHGDGHDAHAAGHDDHHGHDAHHALLMKKVPYLNKPFFIGRSVVYFAIWSILAFILFQRSLKQDKEPCVIKDKVGRICALGMVLFALSVTYAAYDWLMSLEAAWFSTIFGVCYFAACFLSMIAFTSLIVVYLRKHGILGDIITIEHYHDLGKWMFAFTIFWTYVSFSQYFLIWYGNLPEETFWYHLRWEGGWKTWSVLLVLGHFVIPFLFLLSREPKRNPKCLAIAAGWILLFHWVEMYWQVSPAMRAGADRLGAAATSPLSWQDPAAFAAIGGFFVFLFWRRLAAHPLIPVGDSKLKESIRFHNV